jgi:hypothetical protein
MRAAVTACQQTATTAFKKAHMDFGDGGNLEEQPVRFWGALLDLEWVVGDRREAGGGWAVHRLAG